MLRKIALKLGFGWLGRELRAIAEGQRGTWLKRCYDRLAGWKTASGFALAALVVALTVLGQTTVAETIAGSVGSLGLVGLGLLDKAWREQVPSWVTMSPVYTLARDHVADLAALVAIASAQLATCSVETATLLAKLHLTCGVSASGLAVLVGLAGWLGLEVGAEPPPRTQRR